MASNGSRRPGALAAWRRWLESEGLREGDLPPDSPAWTVYSAFQWLSSADGWMENAALSIRVLVSALAWDAGHLTDDQAAMICGVSLDELRNVREYALQHARQLWMELQRGESA
jgi:hypothetical protein